MNTHWTLVGDIGGTNLRLALARRHGRGWRLAHPANLSTAGCHDLRELLRGYLVAAGRPELSGCAVCGAGPVVRRGRDSHIRLTNAGLLVRSADLRRATGVPHPQLLNDFAALARSVSALGARDLRFCGGGRAHAQAARAIIGPGTGLGVAGLAPHAGGYLSLASEGGHMDLTPVGRQEIALWRQLGGERRPLESENVFSGPGLLRLYRALCRLRRHAAQAGRPEQVAVLAARGDKLAGETLAVFTRWFGRFCGDVALTLGAQGGVYLGGGILPAWGRLFDARLFRRGFEDKGRFRPYLEQIPVWLITRPDAALLGLAEAAQPPG